MIPYIVVTIIVLLVCIVFILLIRNNVGKMKLKREYGEVIQAKVSSWDIVYGRPTRYIVKVEYVRDKKTENKTLVTSGGFAKKYEYEKNIQIVIVPNSKKIFFEEENWNSENIVFFIFLIIAVSFLIQFLLIGFIILCV